MVLGSVFFSDGNFFKGYLIENGESAVSSSVMQRWPWYNVCFEVFLLQIGSISVFV